MTRSTATLIRWAVRADTPAILANNAEPGGLGWPKGHFLKVMGDRHTICIVAEDSKGRVVGHVVYRRHADCLAIINLAVAADCQGRGIGRELVGRVVGKLDAARCAVTTLVPDDCLGCQLFLRKLGFRAERVVRGAYGGGRDGYRMALRPDFGGRGRHRV